jgi:hypothetical protein
MAHLLFAIRRQIMPLIFFMSTMLRIVFFEPDLDRNILLFISALPMDKNISRFNLGKIHNPSLRNMKRNILFGY